MIVLFAQVSEASLATAFGAAGLSAQLIWPLFRSRESMLKIQLVAASSYAAGYSVLGQNTAAAVCFCGAFQTTIALLAGDRPWLARMGCLLLPVVLTLGALTYSGIATYLAVTACCLTMIGRMQSDTLRMRGIQLTAAPIGAAHDLFVGAWPCLAGALFSFAISLAAFRRELKSRRHGPATA